MNWEFVCPNCKHSITENDFNKNEKILANLKDIFDKHKNSYIQDLEKKLVADLQERQKDQLSKMIAEKELELNKQKQEEVDKLKQTINEQKIELEKNEVNLENQLMIKQQEIRSKYEEKIETLNSKVKDLEIANATNKVIQNKTKGENFEHEVHGELLKVFDEYDKVTKITSQDKKADYLQEVRTDDKKNIIGKIVYEVKNAEWSNTWEKKLVEDMAKQGSKYGILVATSFNKKYPNIPFKKSDENSNIYLCDPDSFIFVGQIIRNIIKIEYKFNSQKSQTTSYDEKINKFNSWKEAQLPRLIRIFEDNFKRINLAETSITKQVDEIRIAKENMYKKSLQIIIHFLEDFSI